MILGIVRKRSTYYFRGYIPKKLSGIINQATIDRSLKTKNKKAALRLVKHYEIQFKYLMKGFKIALENKNELYSFLDNYLNDYLSEREEHLYLSPFTLISEQVERGYFAERIESLQYMIHDNNFKEADEFIKDALKNYTSPLDDADILDASLFIIKRLLQQEEYVRQKAIDGSYNVSKSSTNPYFKATKTEQESKVNNSHVITQPQRIETETETKPNLKKYTEEYIKEKNIEMVWAKDALGNNKVIMKSLLYQFGDIDIATIERIHLLNYKNKLQHLPIKWGDVKNNKFNSYHTLDKIIMQNKTENIRTLSYGTISKYIAVVKSFFEFCTLRGYIERNIAHKLPVKQSKTSKQGERLPFTLAELEKLFSAPFYTKKLEKNIEAHIERIFIPIIALYSGMRLNEISSLYIEDIKQEHNIYFFDINDNEDKTLKNPQSQRRVPIHPKIIETGFLDFVHNLQSNSSGRLWINLKKQKKYSDSDSNSNEGRYSKDISNWFRYINRKYITKDPQKVFHSFRHNTIDCLMRQEIQEALVGKLVGHVHSTITYKIYGHGYIIKSLYETINTLEYDVPSLNLAIKNIGTYIKQKNTTI